MSILYKTKAIISGGREANISLSDNSTIFKLSKPKELAGEGADKGLNPEQLFAAGYGACFEGALHHLSKTNKIGFISNKIETTVALGKNEAGLFLEVAMNVFFDSSVDQSVALKLLEDTHNFCPYSKAVKSSIKVDIKAIFE